MQHSCFLFGHADAPNEVRTLLIDAIQKMVNKGIKDFYVGYRGNFDVLAVQALQTVKGKEEDIHLYLVLSNHPWKKDRELPACFNSFYYPDLLSVPPALAIVKTNQHIVRQVGNIICYAKHPGNALKLLDLAERQQKKRKVCLVNLANKE